MKEFSVQLPIIPTFVFLLFAVLLSLHLVIFFMYLWLVCVSLLLVSRCCSSSQQTAHLICHWTLSCICWLACDHFVRMHMNNKKEMKKKEEQEEEVHILAFWKETFCLWKENYLAFWWLSGSVPLGCFFAPLYTCVGHENTWRWMVGWYKGL